jgi:hypothetical protein
MKKIILGVAVLLFGTTNAFCQKDISSTIFRMESVTDDDSISLFELAKMFEKSTSPNIEQGWYNDYYTAFAYLKYAAVTRQEEKINSACEKATTFIDKFNGNAAKIENGKSIEAEFNLLNVYKDIIQFKPFDGGEMNPEMYNKNELMLKKIQPNIGKNLRFIYVKSLFLLCGKIKLKDNKLKVKKMIKEFKDLQLHDGVEKELMPSWGKIECDKLLKSLESLPSN